jgi:hypothetical protein
MGFSFFFVPTFPQETNPIAHASQLGNDRSIIAL